MSSYEESRAVWWKENFRRNLEYFESGSFGDLAFRVSDLRISLSEMIRYKLLAKEKLLEQERAKRARLKRCSVTVSHKGRTFYP